MSMHVRFNWIPITLVLCGAMAVGVVGAVHWALLGWWEALLFAGLASAVSVVFWFRRKLGATEIELERLRARLAAEEVELNETKRQWDAQKQQITREFEQQSNRLEKREQSLAQRFLTYHEWMEFPKPINLNSPAEPTDAELLELVRKDRQMLALLKDETQVLYDNILANRYVPDGEFDPEILFHDARELMTKVARIYEPNAERPLLETSLPLIIRGASRACLQMLVLLDELPLDVRKYNVNRLANYIRRAVQAYRVYKSSEPYWPWVNTAWYLSRFAMGTNPVTLGAWWFVSSLSKHGASAIAQHLVNRQALTLLASVVRVIGYEVASLYGGDFRHRDANWFYAVELTELVSQFPMSRDSLSHALRELGALQFRSEYDRVFLYRCLAAHAGSRPQQYNARVVLTPDERTAVAGRLERFLATFIHGKSNERIAKWKAGVEERLGAKLSVGEAVKRPQEEQLSDAVRSLASFVVGVKERDIEALPAILANSPLLAEIPNETQAELFGRLHDNPPYFFEHPDLDPDGELATRYLEELVRLHVELAPREPQIEQFLGDAAAYLRKEDRWLQTLLDKQFQRALAERFPEGALPRKTPRPVARAVLDLLADDQRPLVLYSGVSIDWPASVKDPPHLPGALWLLATRNRLLLFTPEPQPKLLWRSEAAAVSTDIVRGYVTGHCRLNGGTWVADHGLPAPSLRIAAPLVGSTTTYFAPLLDLVAAEKSARVHGA